MDYSKILFFLFVVPMGVGAWGLLCWVFLYLIGSLYDNYQEIQRKKNYERDKYK